MLLAATAARADAPIPAMLQVLGSVSSATRPISNALVIALNLKDLDAIQTFTAADGTFTLPPLPSGIYKLIAVKQGFAPAIATVLPTKPSHTVKLSLDREDARTRKTVSDEMWQIRASLPPDILRELDQTIDPPPQEALNLPRVPRRDVVGHRRLRSDAELHRDRADQLSASSRASATRGRSACAATSIASTIPPTRSASVTRRRSRASCRWSFARRRPIPTASRRRAVAGAIAIPDVPDQRRHALPRLRMGARRRGVQCATSRSRTSSPPRPRLGPSRDRRQDGDSPTEPQRCRRQLRVAQESLHSAGNAAFRTADLPRTAQSILPAFSCITGCRAGRYRRNRAAPRTGVGAEADQRTSLS